MNIKQPKETYTALEILDAMLPRSYRKYVDYKKLVACMEEYKQQENPQAQSEWISVDERLPETDDEVLGYLVKTTGSNKYYKLLTFGTHGWTDEQFVKVEETQDMMEVKYWQPLPQPPYIFNKEKFNDIANGRD